MPDVLENNSEAGVAFFPKLPVKRDMTVIKAKPGPCLKRIMNQSFPSWLGVVLVVTLLIPVGHGMCGGVHRDALSVFHQRPAVEDHLSDDTSGPAEKPSFGEKLKSHLTHIGLDIEALKLWFKWVVGAPVLVVTILIFMLLRPRRATAPPREEAIPDETPDDEPRPQPLPTRQPSRRRRPEKPPTAKTDRPAVKMSDHQQVLRFFLQLFKSQLDVEADSPAQLVRTATRPTCPDETYEMRVMNKVDWETRRMSIGLLGQGGGSRSKCFYVIYDSHMVIKIPGFPMTKFSEYKRQVAAEGRIVSRLAPRQCIVPRVSVILKAVHNFANGAHMSEELMESRYMQLVETNPEFQEHLKIGESFAFFMDLAKHFFLSTVLDDIHSGYSRIADEARQYPELLWDQHAFVCRYGEDSGGVCHALQEAYYRCEDRLRKIVAEAGASKSINTYHFKQWFLAHMVGESIQRDEYELPADAISKANELLNEVVDANQHSVERYRQQLKEYIRKTRFSKYRHQVESLASNILDLLAWIGKKQLALRDLKPENLFVAGNPDEYPQFLNTPEKFSLGLIDVETAVALDAEDPILIPQPQLAGTPLYATPTHLMSNAILLEIYEDLPLILHLQDWHATIAMLFKLITGQPLFGTTAHVFPELLSRLKVLDPTGADLQDDVARICGLFWNSAVAEFQAGLAEHAATISSVEVSVPADIVDEIKSELKIEIRETEKAVAKAVDDQSFFKSGDRRRFLKAASSVKINQMMSKLTQEIESGSGPSQEQVLLYFELLQKLKQRLESKQHAVVTLENPTATIAADQLLEVMFQKVFSAMYPAHWPPIAPRLYGSSSFLATDITTYQATM